MWISWNIHTRCVDFIEIFLSFQQTLVLFRVVIFTVDHERFHAEKGNSVFSCKSIITLVYCLINIVRLEIFLLIDILWRINGAYGDHRDLSIVCSLERSFLHFTRVDLETFSLGDKLTKMFLASSTSAIIILINISRFVLQISMILCFTNELYNFCNCVLKNAYLEISKILFCMFHMLWEVTSSFYLVSNIFDLT